MVTLPANELRVMVDANILVSGTIWPRWPYEVLQHAVNGNYHLMLTDEITGEAQDTIERLAPERLGGYFALLNASQYEDVAVPSEAELNANAHLIRDFKDVHVALAAINARQFSGDVR
jgi:predicted nucleic acid-binding protein